MMRRLSGGEVGEHTFFRFSRFHNSSTNNEMYHAPNGRILINLYHSKHLLYQYHDLH
eukprot:UN03830